MKHARTWDVQWCVDCRKEVDTVHDRRHGDVLCPNCGLVLQSGMLEEREECRTFYEDGEDRSRVGGPTSYVSAGGAAPDVGKLNNTRALSTVIARGAGRGPGGQGAPDPSRSLARLQAKAGGQSARQKTFEADRSAMMACMRGDVLQMVYGSGAFEYAIQLYAVAFHESKLAAADKPAIQAACVHCACAARKEGRDVGRICVAFSVDELALPRALSKLHEAIRAHPGFTDEERRDLMCTSTNFEALVIKIAADMVKSVSKRNLWPLQYLARWIMSVVHKTGSLDGCHESTKCIAAVYVAANELGLAEGMHPAKVVSQAMNVSVETIKRHIKTIDKCVRHFKDDLARQVAAAMEKRDAAFKRKYGFARAEDGEKDEGAAAST